MKKIITILIALIFALSICSCTKKEEPQTADKTQTQTTAPASKEPNPEPSASEEASSAQTQVHEDKDFVLTLLDSGKLVFMETTEDMTVNKGESFGEISKKQPGDGGYEFTFVPNVNEHMPLVTRLDEFEGAVPLGGQAVFLRFKTSTTGIYISFLGDNDFGVYFGSEGEPLVFTYTENNPFPFEGELKLETNKWYNMLMAMDSEGTFNCIIYLDDEIDNLTSAAVSLGETQSGAGYMNQSWQFEIATHEEGSVTVEHYDVYAYSTYMGE